MAVIKCSNCENEILDSEIVCPYCDYPVDASKKAKDEVGASENDKAAEDVAKSSVKIASIEDFEKEKSELLKKLEDEAKVLEKEPDKPEAADTEEADKEELNGETLRISKIDIMAERSKEGDFGSARDVSATAAKIKIDKPNTSGRSSATKSSKKSVEKNSRIVAVVLTVIGIIVAAVAIYYLCENAFPTINKKLEGKQNKPATVVKSDSQTEELGYKFETKNTLVIIDSEAMKDYSPDEKAPWADSINDIRHIRIDDSVEYIGAYSFYQFTKLEDVVLGQDVREIGESAFYGCTSLKSVKGRSNSELKIIGDYAFTKCSKLESFDIDAALKSIGEGAFKGCASLEEMEIPSNVNIGSEAFIGCSPDFTIICSKNNERAIEYAEDNGINIEFYDEDEEPDEASEESKPNQDGSDKKTDDKKTDDKKTDDKNSDKNTDKTGDKSGEQKPSKNDSTPTSSSGKTQSELIAQINEKNEKINDPNTTDDERKKLISERDALSVELDKLIE